MRPSFVTFVKPRRPVRADSPALLPPLKLYRAILRSHRKLPQLHRDLGDQYVKAEFKAHKSIDNPLHIVGFLTSWQDYLTMVDQGKWMSDESSGADKLAVQGLTMEMLDSMSEDQIVQLYELMKETKKVAGIKE
ncbi:hypothetical protein BABINDRAFT_162822 [Babjeviella inositovora NRRL Y-12698]|uniref:Succinate dehydrogenase assembly factor 3 n=1 Tax=Babjeviella inositovora NRRL Y-12698 TaxID=984486 RepID=A0A1E3QKD1_9ASCO|nr:uncharacterized protein BABINDRAFT_162822 [Babjeviella inositovora NRRL Y-12698]ODQ78149.1 hypothetical protein BABINDRAFT_162822 [Babjeviella inositovora NRRL Y-12698]